RRSWYKRPALVPTPCPRQGDALWSPVVRMCRILPTSPARHARILGLIALVLLLGVSACRMTDVVIWHPAQPPQGSALKVRQLKGVVYDCGARADECGHRVDLFLAQGLQRFPVVLLVHGGVWMVGDNRCCGLYSSVGEFLASQGIAAVLPNYRLSPGVKHPGHV